MVTIDESRLLRTGAVSAAEQAQAQQVELLEQTVDRMWHALGQIPESNRLALLLRRIEGLETEEIGARLGVTPATAERDIAAALRHVRRSVLS